MKVSIDTIRSLDASKTYYIANSTGEIAEATPWQKFKCFFGIGDGREKAAKLVEAVKKTLLEASDKISDANLNASVRNFEDSRSRFFSVSGRAMAELATTFTSANAADIARIQAGQIAKRPLEESVKSVQTTLLLGDERIDDVMEVMKRAVHPLIDNPPMKTDAAGCRVLDEEAFTAELANVLEDAERTVADVSKSSPTGRARFDVAVRDMMFATLYGPDGKRNAKDVSAMGSIADIRFNRVMSNVAGYCPNEGVTKEEFAALARKLVDACGEDPDMLDASEYTARRFLVTGGGKARMPDEIVKRVAECRANQKELFAAIGGDRTLRGIARTLTKALSGLPFPPGTFTKAIEAIKAIDLAPFQNLDEMSDSLDIHNAVMALNKAVRSVLRQSGALSKLDGQDDEGPFRDFVARALFARLPKSALRGVSKAMSSPLAAKLVKFYDDLATGTKKMPKNNLPVGVEEEVKSQLMTLFNYADVLKEAAEKALGRTDIVLVNTDDAAKASNDGFYPGDILDSIHKESAAFVAEKRDEFLNGVVKGKDQAAELVRGLFADVIGPAPSVPSNVAFAALNGKTVRMMNANIMDGARAVMRGRLDATQLFLDIDRGMEVTLTGVGKLSKDFPTALDQIARFVTGRADAKFETLDDVSKKKAAIVIGFLGQDSEKAVVDGCGYALDPTGDAPIISYGGDQSRDKKVYTLEFVHGQLNVNLDIVQQRKAILYKGDLVEAQGGITVKGGFGYTITENEMRRLTGLDLSAYDDTKAIEKVNKIGEGGIYENRIEKMYDEIPEQYKIKASCKTYFEVEMRG